MTDRGLSRRAFVQISGTAAVSLGLRGSALAEAGAGEGPLGEVEYQQVTVNSAPHLARLQNTQSVLMSIRNDSLLKARRMMGSLVLFAKTEPQPVLTRERVLGARRSAGEDWVIDTYQEPLSLVPFTEIGDAAYSTYLKLS